MNILSSISWSNFRLTVLTTRNWEGEGTDHEHDLWNLPHGQCSKIDHGHWNPDICPKVNGQNGILSSISYSNFRLTILTTRNLNFNYSHSQNLDYLTRKFQDYGHGHVYKMTMTTDTLQFSLWSWSNGCIEIDHANFGFWPWSKFLAIWPQIFEILAMGMVKNLFGHDHDFRTSAKWSKNRGCLTPHPNLHFGNDHGQNFIWTIWPRWEFYNFELSTILMVMVKNDHVQVTDTLQFSINGHRTPKYSKLPELEVNQLFQ